MSRHQCALLVAVLLAALLMPLMPASAQVSDGSAFHTTWQRTDQPIATGIVSRTWMWGPRDNVTVLSEPYAQSPGGQRQVAYFDKSRMEITDPTGDQSSIWYVTNGLLTNELVSGRMQTGDSSFEQRPPAQVNVAGDAGDPGGPTYATFNAVLNVAPAQVGALLTQRITRNGVTSNDASLGQYGVTAAIVDDVTFHSIASPFWDFMTATGTVYQSGTYATDLLFQNPFFATGRPITEAYWSQVQVAGVQQDVLMQCFERRCLTFTPNNPSGWQVEAGNVGQHYYTWRYGSTSPQPPPSNNPPISEQEYVEQVTTIYQQLVDSIELFLYLIAEGDPNDPQVRNTIASEIASWRGLAIEMSQIHPPSTYVQIQTRLLDGYSYMMMASDHMYEGFVTGDAETFIYGVEQMDIGFPIIREAMASFTVSPVPPGEPGLTEAEYLELIWAIDDEFLYSVDYFFFLIENMDPSDYTWIDAYFYELETWRYLALLIYEIAPPPSYSEVHDLMTIAYLYIFDAAEKLATALGQSDANIFEQGLESLFTGLAILDEVFVFIPSDW